MACTSSERERSYKITFERLWDKNRIILIQFLLDAGIDVNVLSKFRKSLLTSATEIGSLEMTQFLCDNGADIHVRNGDGTNPLHLATCHGRLNIVRYLISRGVSPNIYDNEGNTPLHFLSNSLPMIDQFSRKNFRDIVRFLIDSGADINFVNHKALSPLLSVAQRAHQHLVKLYLNFGARVDFYSDTKWTILHHSCCFGWFDIVRTFMEGTFNIDPNLTTSEGFTPMYLAATNSHRRIVELFMHLGANVSWNSVDRTTFLHCCCANGWLDFVQYLVNIGFDIHAVNAEGLTPFAMAANGYHLNVILYLIGCGANYKNYRHRELRRKLLHLACEEDWLELVKFLIQNKCDLNPQDLYKDTPLHLAIREQNKAVVKCMLKAGADCNLENDEKLSPFKEWIQEYFVNKHIYWFLDNGAYFRENDNEEMQILLKRGFLQNVNFCATAFINRVNNEYLPKVYKIPVLAKMLPPLHKMQELKDTVIWDVLHNVSLQIQTRGYYDILHPRPPMLRSLCCKSLVEHYQRRTS